ncbi:MAG: hypothetical protein QXH94_05475 [Sulfolobales archaeon]
MNRRVGGTTHPRITYKNLERETVYAVDRALLSRKLKLDIALNC